MNHSAALDLLRFDRLERLAQGYKWKAKESGNVARLPPSPECCPRSTGITVRQT
jgi:hypothetical protein